MGLYDQHFSKVYTSVYNLIGNQMDAEDIVQDSFLDAFQKLDQLKDASKFGGWIKRIAINKCMARFRSASYKLESEIEDIQLSDEDDDIDWGQFDVESILAAIRKLPDGYSQVLSLHLLEDMKHEEIGEALGISASSSRSQYARAKKKLKEYFNEHYGQA